MIVVGELIQFFKWGKSFHNVEFLPSLDCKIAKALDRWNSIGLYSPHLLESGGWG